MKLNKQRPNNGWTPICVKISLWLLALTLPLASATNQTHWGTQVGQESASGHNVSAVSDLKLTADLRAVRLSWRYPCEQSNRPKAFSVRYCELTSWNVEIKCRHKELLVGDSRAQPETQLYDSQGQSSSEAVRARQEGQEMHPTPPMQPTQPTAGGRENSVIKSPEEFVLNSRESPDKFEGEIYDLRALTNYTFQVRPSPADGRRASARHLADVAAESRGRVETKPFAAQASKCLADVSEVVINTGRYFGGRISVEGSADKRCSLLGNRSSEQTSYTFRVEHQRCASRTVDGRRIETMILVHENKDLLTHNTARFLVVCNFLQQSFTVRASVSLPTVNSQVSQRRPAIVQQLSGRPANELAQLRPNVQQAPSVSSIMLGSMRGTYRSRSAGELADDVVSNTIDRSGEDALRESPANSTLVQHSHSEPASKRQPKELPSWHRATSDSAALPAPVQVSSGLLHVGDSSTQPLRAAKQLRQPQQWPTTTTRRTPLIRSQSDATNSQLTDNSSAELSADASERTELDLHAPVVITNNHRVSDNFPTLNGQLTAPKYAHPTTGWPANSADQVSIKYSADRVDEYPLDAGGLAGQLARAQANSRGARMRAIDLDQPDEPLESPQGEPNSGINRMGESAVSSSESKEPLEIVQPSAVSGNSTLAHNITSYLLRWSLRTLTSLARKSLESLAKVNGSAAELSGQEESAGSSGRQLSASQSSSSLDPLAEDTTQPQAELSATRGSQTEATKPPTATTESPPTTELLDGFLTGRRRANDRPASKGRNATAAEPTPTLAPTTSSPRSAGRPSNYSKSIDFMRADNPTKHRPTDAGKPVQSPISERRSGETSQRSPGNQSAVANENRRNSRAPSSWLLCGILGAVALVIGVFVTLWLLQPAGPTTKRLMFASPINHSHNSYACNQVQVTARQTALAPNASNVDSLESPTRLLACPPVQSSHSAGRSSVGSGSCASSGSHEHDCKDSELLYTEHVLIDTDADSGESYA